MIYYVTWEPLFSLIIVCSKTWCWRSNTSCKKGIAEGCIRSECALVGGETAEMPGMYKEGDFDLAGFCVGIAEKDELNRVERINVGDILICITIFRCSLKWFLIS